MTKTPSPNALARTLRGFFSEYVPEMRGLSRHTLLSYRDTIALLLRFVAASRKTDPVAPDLEAISPEAVSRFPELSGAGTSQQGLPAQRTVGCDPRLLSLRSDPRAGAH